MIQIDLQVPTDAQAPVTGIARNLLFLFEVVKNPFLVAVLVAVFGGAFWALNQTNSLNAAQAVARDEMEQQQRDSARFAKQLLDAKNLKEQQARYEKLVGRIRGVDDNRYSFLHLMDEAARALPTDSWIREVSTTKQDETSHNVTVKIVGYGPNETSVTEYLQRLNESPWITNGSIQKIEKTPVNRQVLVQFELEIDSEIPDQIWIQSDPISKVFGVKTPLRPTMPTDSTGQQPPGTVPPPAGQ